MPETLPVRWPEAAAPTPDHKPGMVRALARGSACKCPNCGKAPLFTGWLRQVSTCARCGTPLGRYRADDAPPYFVIFLVAHLVIGAQVAVDSAWNLSLWTEAAIFLPLTLLLSLGLLRPVKGATIGLMLQLGMAGPAATPAPPIGTGVGA